jgi:hypothetical protein
MLKERIFIEDDDDGDELKPCGGEDGVELSIKLQMCTAPITVWCYSTYFKPL